MSVPAIMAARTAENDRGRLLTILVTPLTICSARQVVAVALIGAFFLPRYASWVMLGLYIFSFALICLVSVILKNTVLKVDIKPFYIELPMYRLPNWRNIGTYAWQKTRSYLERAATFIAARPQPDLVREQQRDAAFALPRQQQERLAVRAFHHRRHDRIARIDDAEEAAPMRRVAA